MKFPFTPAGVQSLQVKLNAMDDAQLAAEASKVSSNLLAWLVTTFELSLEQINYAAQLNATFSLSVTANLAMAIENRLPISLDKPLQRLAQESSQPEGSKLIRETSAVRPIANESGGYSAEGEAAYEIIYA